MRESLLPQSTPPCASADASSAECLGPQAGCKAAAAMPLRLKKTLMRVARCLRSWWQVTTDEAYMQSKISRRPSLKLSLPVMPLFFLAGDAVIAWSGEGPRLLLAMDLFIVVAACCYRFSAITCDSLLVDVAVVALLTAYMCCGQVVAATDIAQSPGLEVDTFPAIAFCVAVSGLHSLVAIWFCLFSMAWSTWYVCIHGLDYLADCLSDVLFTALIAAAAVALEFLMASLFRDLQTQLQCNQKLLEGATDGFGVVDRLSGLVLEASPKMLETLDSLSLVGSPLLSGIEDSQASALAPFFGAAAQTSAAAGPAPVLVTWSSATLDCDVRLVPYELQGTHIGFSIQRVGEARKRGGGAADDRCSDKDHGRIRGSREVFSSSYLALASRARKQSGAVHSQPAADLKSQSSKSRGTLSLSSLSLSFTASNADGGAAAAAAAASAAAPSEEQLPSFKSKKVPMTTIATQTEQPPPRRTRLPAPLTASSLPPSSQARAVRRARLARSSAAAVEEGRARMPIFKATPRATRLHMLQTVARGCNVTGSGCCEKHITWMGLQGLIAEILVGPCSDFACFDGWQCSHCFAVHEYFGEEEDREEEQFCPFCIDMVLPILAGHHAPPAELSTATGTESGCEADVEVREGETSSSAGSETAAAAAAAAEASSRATSVR